MSLGCRNISPWRLIDEESAPRLDSWAQDTFSDRIFFPRRPLARLYRLLPLALIPPWKTRNRQPAVSDNRPAKRNRSTRRASLLIIVLIISVTQSTRRCRALASRHPSELLDSLVSVCRRDLAAFSPPATNPPAPLHRRVFLYDRPSLFHSRQTSGRILVSS